MNKVDGKFRRVTSLSNFIPTPVSLNDISGYLLRATESSLFDTIYSIIIIFNLDQNFDDVKKEFSTRLDPKFKYELEQFILHVSAIGNYSIVTDHYIECSEDNDLSFLYYRCSSAFLERPFFALYRNKIDRVIGVRLLTEVFSHDLIDLPDNVESDNLLLENDGIDLNESLPIKLDSFYRTYLFLKMISNKVNILTLSNENIRFIFENTHSLETLLKDDEMRTILQICPIESKGLVHILALTLFRNKSIDPDVDFEFRTSFISYIQKQYDGSIIKFITDLLNDSPNIANYIVASLDEVTLEKMYTLVENASDASNIRHRILELVGKKLNRLDYIIEAESIKTRSKLSKLQKYFDSSRMYVDSTLMKKWLDSNPSIATEQYRTLYSRLEGKISNIKYDATNLDVLIISLIDESEYLISQIAIDSFEQFCLNNEFGIQSYLGRRIRHNTLDGVTIDTVDAVLRKPVHGAILSNPKMAQAVQTWLSTYKSIIDKLRRDYLQFKSTNSLFNAVLDIRDTTTKDNIRILSKTLQTAGGNELMNDLIIAFCWKQITPQLENAARFIRIILLQEAKESIDKYFPDTNSVINAIKTELHEAVNEVFKKVSDWFQVPETGFIPASIRDLCQIILIDLHRKNDIIFDGNALDVKYTGISVHRLYDCLAVLLQNALLHGEKDSSITINVCALKTDSLFERVTINIKSTVCNDNYENSKHRIFQAINSEEDGSDMVTEGYTGIKKIKFITRLSEGKHTMNYQFDDSKRELNLEFSIRAETAKNDITNRLTE